MTYNRCHSRPLEIYYSTHESSDMHLHTACIRHQNVQTVAQSKLLIQLNPLMPSGATWVQL